MGQEFSPDITRIRDQDVVAPVTPVIVQYGSISLTVSDIELGAVEIKDATTDTRAKVSAANTARTTGDNVILIQNVDSNGEVLLQATQQNIEDNTTLNLAWLETIQNTLANISALANAGTTPQAVTLFNAATGVGDSAVVDVESRSKHAIQVIVSGGTSDYAIKDSLDGVNWHTEVVAHASDYFSFDGMTKYFKMTIINSNAVVTGLLLSSPPGV